MQWNACIPISLGLAAFIYILKIFFITFLNFLLFTVFVLPFYGGQFYEIVTFLVT